MKTKKKVSKTENLMYDAHCHLFTKDIISRRIIFSALFEIKDMIKISSKDVETDKEKTKQSDNILKRLKRIKNFLYIGTQENSTQIFELLDNEYNNSEMKFVPLMFDLKFCFQEKYDDTDEMLLTKSFEKQKEFDLLFSEFDNFKLIADEIITKSSGKLRDLSKKMFINISENIDNLKLKRQDNFAKYLISNAEQHSFEAQINQIIELKKQYPSRVYPFLSVDPRRKNILNLVKFYVGKNKPFHGVKLYCANGYSPTDPVLYCSASINDCIYNYCTVNNIPIIAHCSNSGFSNFVNELEVRGYVYIDNQLVMKNETDKIVNFKKSILRDGVEAIEERQSVLNHPKLWEKVLEKYKNLRLNLAHFGGDRPDSDEFRTEIFRLIKSGLYPNLYTDLSCITEKDVLKNIKLKLYPEIKEKIMYGSDYYLNMVFIDDFKSYYKQFTQIFDNQELNQISKINPEKFLF